MSGIPDRSISLTFNEVTLDASVSESYMNREKGSNKTTRQRVVGIGLRSRSPDDNKEGKSRDIYLKFDQSDRLVEWLTQLKESRKACSC